MTHLRSELWWFLPCTREESLRVFAVGRINIFRRGVRSTAELRSADSRGWLALHAALEAVHDALLRGEDEEFCTHDAVFGRERGVSR